MDWRLICGRAQDVLPGAYAGAIDLAITSPPYDALRQYGGHIGDWDFPAVAAAVVPCLKDGGVLVWVVSDQVCGGSETGQSFAQASHFLRMGLSLHQTLIWRKPNPTPPRTPNRYAPAHEYMFVFSRGVPKTAAVIRDKPNLMAGKTDRKVGLGRSGDGKNYRQSDRFEFALFGSRTSVWDYKIGWGNTVGKSESQVTHPAAFPYRLAADHIRSWSEPGDTVLDPLAGSGTVGRAAVNLGRRALMVEVNPEYCAAITRRMAQGVLL